MDPMYIETPNIFGSHRGVVANVQGCGLIVSEFKLQKHYCIYFRSNALGKRMNLFISPAMG